MADDCGRTVREAFVLETDNGGPGPLLLFYVHPDGQRQLALPEHVEEFTRQAVKQAMSVGKAWQELSSITPQCDTECPHCGGGYILPSGRCDHCNLRFNEPGY